MIKRLLPALFAFFLLPPPLLSATYTVIPEPAEKALLVTLRLNKGTATRFWMPAWAPGDYRIVNFGKYVQVIRLERAGNPITFTRETDPNLWIASEPADTVVYRVTGTPGGPFSDNLRITNQELFWNGPAVLGYFEGYQNETHLLRVRRVPENAHVECSLEKVDDNNPNFFAFKAPHYDALVDAPFVMSSSLKVQEFHVRGKPHAIVAFNRAEGVNLQPYADLCAKIVEHTARIFGELPYARYLFLIDFGGPGGGLEHADSSRVGIPPNLPPAFSASLLAHEYFHAFNVKRIRSKPLGPFDYQKPAVTGALWWLEGVTDYYADVILHRAGITSRREFLFTLAQALRSLERNPNRLRISADESSRRVWEAHNSSGYGLSYYEKGKLIGLCLDLGIRAETRGSRSLDDVLRRLYEECKGDKPGFEENRIREICIEVGGENLGPLYDQCVLLPGELPARELLSRFGYTFDGQSLSPSQNAPQEASSLGARWPLPTNANTPR
jgi:predicted metalloprotease with PDZ domain